MRLAVPGDVFAVRVPYAVVGRVHVGLPPALHCLEVVLANRQQARRSRGILEVRGDCSVGIHSVSSISFDSSLRRTGVAAGLVHPPGKVLIEFSNLSDASGALLSAMQEVLVRLLEALYFPFQRSKFS